MRFKALIPALLILMLTQSAYAVKIADITRMAGARTNTLIGMGLVVGLKGTGDGGSFLPTTRVMACILGKLSNTTNAAELTNGANVALVNVWATIPANGVRNGDHLDVHVASSGPATSLEYGTLFMTSLVGPDGKPYRGTDANDNPSAPMAYATANGLLECDAAHGCVSGVVKGGAVMEVDLPVHCIDHNGRFTLILDDAHASWIQASNMAKLINESNESSETIATAVDPKQVIVQIPPAERAAPDSFIANVLQLQLRIDAETAVKPAANIPQAARSGSSVISQWWQGICLLVVGWLGSRKTTKQPSTNN